jgi:drug/metabolite transporter (DMT)-like permease
MGIQQPSRTPKAYVVNASLILCQLFFGLGSVITALGLPASNPFAFGLYREISAGLLLLAAAHITTKTTSSVVPSGVSQSFQALIYPLRTDLETFLLLGLFIFGNQAAIVAGVKLLGPVTAAVWQPSQPIMTAAISMVSGREPWNSKRIAGIIFATFGCMAMVLIMSKTKQQHAHTAIIDGNEFDINIQSLDTSKLMVGHALFFTNCLCTSLYVIISKRPLQKYPPLLVTAWSYNLAAVFMSATCFVTSSSVHMMTFLCPDCTSTWTIPFGAIPALLYNILFNSVLAYGILTWANQYATGTLVMIFTVLQPVTAAMVTVLLVNLLQVYPNCKEVDNATKCLDPPSFATIVGMIGVVSGLLLVVSTENSIATQPGKRGDNGKAEQSRETELLISYKNNQELEMT